MTLLMILLLIGFWTGASALSIMSKQNLLGNNNSMPLDGMPNIQNNGHSCRRNATCFATNHTKCLGVVIPYQYISSPLFSDIGRSQFQLLEELNSFEKLRHLPKCWGYFQPLVCALVVPRCDPDSGTVDLPNQLMCKALQSPCSILYDSLIEWLPYLNCSDIKRFPECKNEAKEVRYNSQGQCLAPLVPTEIPGSMYEGVGGCGLQCQNPMMTKEERDQIHKLVALGGTFALICNVFAVMSFMVDWRSSSKYPALIIFYINFCFMVSNIGWLVQFVPGVRDDVVCKKDGTLRLSEPSAGENLSCVIVFVLIYYFLMAACAWFVILAYAWHIRFKSLNVIQERFDKKAAYFHLIAWSLPLVLTISTMASGQIDGNYISGICFVGYTSHTARVFLLVLPVSTAAVVGAYFLCRVLVTLIAINIGSQEVISEKASAKIRCTIVRVFLFLLCCIIFVIVSLICQIYEMRHEDEWKRSLRKDVLCQIKPFEVCSPTSRPSVSLIQLHLLSYFSAGVLMSFWVWTGSTREAFKRFSKRICSRDVQTRAVVQKHKIIAQAYSKRKELEAGCISISLYETHTDPVGLNFELNSVGTQDFSETWAAALPKLVTRRGALINAPTESSSSHRRRNSYDSEISYSVRRVSVESRRHSLDSQISVQIAELTARRKTSASPRTHATCRKKNRRQRREYGRSRKHQRRGSSTSQDSQMGMQILTALTSRNPNIIPSFLSRRPGNAGLDDGFMNCFPMIEPRQSDDELSNPAGVRGRHGQSCGSEDDLCSPGQGIQSLKPHISDDSDVTSVPYSRELVPLLPALEYRRRTSDSERMSSKHRDSKISETSALKSRRNRLESTSSSRRRTRDSDARRSSRKKTHLKKSDDRDVCKSRDSGGRKRLSDIEREKYLTCKTDDSEEGCSESNSDSGSVTKHSVGTQMAASHGGSSRSKRSVDVATQVSAQEMATQTEPEPLDVTSTASQGTQMTPPFHIRLINKTLGSNGHSQSASYRKYNYSALSLTDQGSDVPKVD